MRIAIALATAFLVAACAGQPTGPILVEVRPEGTAAPIVTETAPVSRADAALPEL
jgi:hypothetical protein